HHDERLEIVERHLGLMPSNESGESIARIRKIGEAISDQVDLGRLVQVSERPDISFRGISEISPLPVREKVKIGIAKDRAFGFYYIDDIEALEAAGAELVEFDTLKDPHLPEIDALFIGGGFPELFGAELEANASLRDEIRTRALGGMPIYAECGGLMYLSRSLTHEGRTHQMVGAIPGDVVMHKKPVGRGFVHLAENEAHPWPCPMARTSTQKAHEFHYSSLENLPGDAKFAYEVARGHGIDGSRDGIVVNNVLAQFTHQRSIGGCYWAARFVAFIARTRRQVGRNESIRVMA
ncbi:MAG TPA: cobyrinic acid a,c-diamide synthase, partial [Burkholderiales bacterium]|nr:cobyrinic acid a,c-diamide synthase [Burkholderiales bacterium]